MNIKVFISSFSYFLFFTSMAQNEIDSLKSLALNSKDTIQIDAMNKWAYLISDTNPDSTLILGQRGEALAIAANYPRGIGNAKMVQGIAKNSLADFYGALQLYLEAKKIFKENDLTRQLAACLANIGTLYSSLEFYDEAIEQYREASTLHAELKDQLSQAMMYNNIGHTARLKGNYKEALPSLYTSLRLVGALNHQQALAFPIYNLGSVYMNLNQSDSAFKYLDQAHELSELHKNQYLLSLTLTDKGRMLLKLGNYDKAESNLLEAYQIASSLNMKQEQKEAARYLSEVYDLKRKMAPSFHYFKIYTAIKDSLFNKEQTKRLVFLEAENEFNQREADKELQQRALMMQQDKELQNARWIQGTLIIGILFISLIAYLFYVNYTRKHKANESLRQLNHQIEEQANQLKLANKEIVIMNSNLEKIINKRTTELKRKNKKLKEYLVTNSHVVRAPVARILGLVELFKEDAEENLSFITDSLQLSAQELDDVLRDINKRLSEEET